jgi:hypothetical protein
MAVTVVRATLRSNHRRRTALRIFAARSFLKAGLTLTRSPT